MIITFKKSIFVYFFLLFGGFVAAQTTIEEKIERKISLSPNIGVSFFPSNVNFSDLGVPKSLFSGYPVSPMIGVSAFYTYNKRVLLGLDASFLLSSRESNSVQANSLNILGISAVTKFYPLKVNKQISPYFLVGFNVSFVNVNQPQQLIVNNAVDTSFLGSGIKTTQATYGNNELNLIMAPVFGPVGGVGLDFKINRKISFFTQVSIQSSFGTNSLIKNNFPTNESNLQFVAFKAGVNIKLFKKMKFDIDTQAVRIPDVIALLVMPELDEEQQQLLSREGNFAINVREGFRHNLKISTNNSQINIKVDPDEDNPCKVKAILYDAFGNKVAETYPDKEGNVNFLDLEKGTYNVAMELQPPCTGSKLAYTLNNPGNEITMQHNEEYTPKVDSLAYNIEGIVDFKSVTPVSKAGVSVILVDKENRQVVAKQVTEESGAFAFKNINPGKYKVIYEVPTKKVQSRIAYNVKDNRQKLIAQESFPFSDVGQKSSEGTRLMNGMVELNDKSMPISKLALDLVDPFNRLVEKSYPNADGTFQFIDAKNSKNEVFVDVSDKKLEHKILENAVTSEGTKAPPLAKTLFYEPNNPENTQKLAELIRNVNNQTGGSMDANPMLKQAELELNKLYDADGKHTVVEGFGYQVGAFRNLQNVYHLMDKLKKQGFEAYMQPVMSNDVNSRFKSSQNYKLNRIIVYGGDNEARSNEIRQKLLDEGHTIIVKERFIPKNIK